ncbi:MAG: MCE family protein [Deltaproteobacteria bacterium]|nr:MCE family protein [Deltaproteobacteria bacterium]
MTENPVFKLSPEAKVGLFVLAGIIILAYMSLRIGGIKFGRAEGYALTVRFASAAGLDKDASVRVAGVEVGKVKEISLKDSHANIGPPRREIHRAHTGKPVRAHTQRRG